LSTPPKTRAYLDAVPVIYLIQQTAPFYAAVAARLADPNLVLVASDLTWMECLVMPRRTGDTQLINEFEDFFNHRVAEMVLMSRSVFDVATDIRAQYPPFRTPDALHLAAAVVSACDVVLTNDQQLRQFTGLTIEVI
jgi:predicted nucleic acid-binding protein